MTRHLLSLSVVGLLLLGGCSNKPSTTTLLREAAELTKKGDPASLQQAVERIESCRQRGDKSLVCQNLYTTCLLRAGRYDDAAKAAAATVQANSEDYLANYLAGKALCEKQQYAEALNYLHKAQAKRPDNRDATILAAVCAARANDPEAQTYFTQLAAMPEFKDRPELYNEIALWNIRRGDYRGGLEMLNKAKALPKVHPLIYLNLAVLYDKYTDLHLPDKARREMASRNYLAFKAQAGTSFPQEGREVQARLRELASAR